MPGGHDRQALVENKVRQHFVSQKEKDATMARSRLNALITGTGAEKDTHKKEIRQMANAVSVQNLTTDERRLVMHLRAAGKHTTHQTTSLQTCALCCGVVDNRIVCVYRT